MTDLLLKLTISDVLALGVQDQREIKKAIEIRKGGAKTVSREKDNHLISYV